MPGATNLYYGTGANKMKKKLLAATISALLASSVSAQNLGFETGDISGWTSDTLTATGSQTVQAGPNTWAINPYGSYMGTLQIQQGTFNSMTSALGLTSTSVSSITSLLQTQAQTGGGNPTPTTAGWVTREVTLTAGTQFSLAWQYISVDYTPFNDGSIATLTKVGSTGTSIVNNYTSQYALLGFTNPGTGDYSTNSYGATGWQVATFNVTESSTYLLGFGVFNLGDTALSPILYIDEVQGSTTKNGTTFGAVAPNNDTAPAATPPSSPTVVSSVSGTPLVSSNTSYGSTVTSTDTNYGTPTAVAVITLSAAQAAKLMNVNKNTTVTTTTPVTTVVTNTTPYTVTTTTTPTTVNTYSDQSVQTVNGTPTTSTSNGTQVQIASNTVDDVQVDSQDTGYSTRIDQYSYMSTASQRINLTLDSDVLSRHVGKDNTIQSKTALAGDSSKGWTYIIAEGARSNVSDTYRMDTQRFGIGHEKLIKSNLIVGAQFNNVQANIQGDQASGNLQKNHIGVYSLYNINSWLLKSDLGIALNDFKNSHSINELGMNNSGKTSGTDVWLANRLYTPNINGFRPFAGARVENTTRKGLTESGTELTAVTYNSENKTSTIGEVGVRYDTTVKKVNLSAEASQTTNDLTTVKVGASFASEKNVLGNIAVSQQRQQGIVNNIIQASIKWFF